MFILYCRCPSLYTALFCVTIVGNITPSAAVARRSDVRVWCIHKVRQCTCTRPSELQLPHVEAQFLQLVVGPKNDIRRIIEFSGNLKSLNVLIILEGKCWPSEILNTYLCIIKVELRVPMLAIWHLLQVPQLICLKLTIKGCRTSWISRAFVPISAGGMGQVVRKVHTRSCWWFGWQGKHSLKGDSAWKEWTF